MLNSFDNDFVKKLTSQAVMRLGDRKVYQSLWYIMEIVAQLLTRYRTPIIDVSPLLWKLHFVIDMK